MFHREMGVVPGLIRESVCYSDLADVDGCPSEPSHYKEARHESGGPPFI
jgi:hypothetical protein